MKSGVGSNFGVMSCKQHLPHPGGVVALRRMPQAEVTHLMEACCSNTRVEGSGA